MYKLENFAKVFLPQTVKLRNEVRLRVQLAAVSNVAGYSFFMLFQKMSQKLGSGKVNAARVKILKKNVALNTRARSKTFYQRS